MYDQKCLNQCVYTTSAHGIQTKRVYDPPARADGKRFLIDRLWPRGIKKRNLKIDGWMTRPSEIDTESVTLESLIEIRQVGSRY